MDWRAVSKEVLALAESEDAFGAMVKEAVEVVRDGLQAHGPDHISIAFNGGKDCTVLLHLVIAVLATTLDPSETSKPIPAINIAVPSPFDSLETFIEEAATKYNLDLFHVRPSSDHPGVESISTPDSLKDASDYVKSVTLKRTTAGSARGAEGMKQALQVYKERYPHITGIFIGTRRTDPHGATLSFRNMTDSDWPQYERVNPIINWSYTDVWTFLRQLNVPYCCLYDEGYTSLGSTYNTFRNPALLVTPNDNQGTDQKEEYRPAYELVDGSLERAGRGQSSASK